MIAHEVTASLYIQTRTNQAQGRIAAAATQSNKNNNNNGGAKNLNAHRTRQSKFYQTTHRRLEDTTASKDCEEVAHKLYFGPQVSRLSLRSRVHFSWPQLSSESLAWPDLKTHTQKSLQWMKSVQWKPDWFKGTSLEEALSVSRTWKSEWLRAKDSLAMPRVPLRGWLGLKAEVMEGTIVPPSPIPLPPPRARR